MKHFSIMAAASLVVLLTVSATPSQARKVSDNKASRLMSLCLLDGGRTSEPNNGRYVKCCTKKGNYCIICKQDGSDRCNKLAYSVRPSAKHRDKALTAGTVAPTKPEARRSALRGNFGLMRN